MVVSIVIKLALTTVIVPSYYVTGLGCQLRWQKRCARAFNAVKSDIDHAVLTAFDTVTERFDMVPPVLDPTWSENTKGVNRHRRHRQLWFDCGNPKCPKNSACATYCGYRRRRRNLNVDDERSSSLKFDQGEQFKFPVSTTRKTNRMDDHSDLALRGDKRDQNVKEQQEIQDSPENVKQQQTQSVLVAPGAAVDEETLRVELTDAIVTNLEIVRGKTQCVKNPKCQCGFDTLVVEVDASI